jgi:hypothetical protein
MEYAIRQSAAAIAREGVEVHFLCKPSFPVERLAAGIKVWEFDKSRVAFDQHSSAWKFIQTMQRGGIGVPSASKRVSIKKCPRPCSGLLEH